MPEWTHSRKALARLEAERDALDLETADLGAVPGTRRTPAQRERLVEATRELFRVTDAIDRQRLALWRRSRRTR